MTEDVDQGEPAGATRELARLAHDYLLSEGHAATWAKCHCYSGRPLHEAIEKVIRVR